MKTFYPIHGVLSYYSPQKADEKGVVWPAPPHLYFANLILDWKSLLAFDRQYGALLVEHWQMAPDLQSILLKAPNLTEEERQRWTASGRKFEIAVSESDVQVAKAMQSLLRDAWNGTPLAIELIEHGDSHHAQREALGPPRLAVATLKPGVAVYAKDMWSFIRIAFLLDYERGRVKVCGNPNCPVPYFLAKRRDQRICERGDCTAWAQRQWALNWWNMEGSKRRQNQRAAKTKRARRRANSRRPRKSGVITPV